MYSFKFPIVKVLNLFKYKSNTSVIPSLPSAPTSELVTSSGFTVRWGTCHDGVNSMYRVEYRRQGESGWTAKNTMRGYEFIRLPHNTLYYVRVSCYWKDDAGLLRIFPDEYKEISVRTHCKGNH